MKKYITLSISLFISFATFSQTTLPEKDGIIVYSEVVQLDSTYKKDQLFLAAKKWFAETYKSANDVIQMQDKEAGEIIGKGLFSTFLKMPFPLIGESVNVYHTVKISVKDGRYRYEITDIYGKYYSSPSTYSSGGWNTVQVTNTPYKYNKKNMAAFNESIHKHILGLIETIKDSMNKYKKESEDW